MTKINFTGNIDDVKKQIEQSVATYELLGNQTSVNLEEWIEGWISGFPEDIENRALGNYLLTGENAWRKDADRRPRWRQWSNKNGFIKGEYWRDRSLDSESIPLSGTATQIIQHIHQIEYEGGGTSGEQEKPSNWPPLEGQPRIKLYFKGEGSKGEISFRIINKTDNLEIPLPQIDKSDLRQYANRIKEQFALPNLFVWKKGKKVVSYKNRHQGFDGQWYLCRNEEEGMALLSKLVAISGFQLDRRKIRLSVAPDEATAFPTSPPDVVVLGESVQQERERPLVDVAFHRAEIKLAKLRSPIPLVQRAVIVYE